MNKNNFLNILFSFILLSVVLMTEVFGCMHEESFQNLESTFQVNSFFKVSAIVNSHTCDVSSNCSHAFCHSNHFCKANIDHSKLSFLISGSEELSNALEKIYKNPDKEIFLRPPILV